MPVIPEALCALFLEQCGTEQEQLATRVEGDLRRDCERMASLSSNGIGATTWSYGDDDCTTWTGEENVWMSVSAPAPPVYNVTAGAPITADTQTRLALGGSVTEWRVSASAADIVDDKTYLQDSALMAVLSILQRQLGGNAVIADTFVLSELMRSFAANLPDDQGEGWPASPASFVLDSTGLDAFRAVALKATSVQPLHAANILERDHVNSSASHPRDGDHQSCRVEGALPDVQECGRGGTALGLLRAHDSPRGKQQGDGALLRHLTDLHGEAGGRRPRSGP